MYYAIISTLLFLVHIFLEVSWRLWKRKFSFVPQMDNLPWVGSIPFATLCPHELYKRRIKSGKEHNYFYMFWFFAVPVVNFGRVEYVESLLSSRESLKKSKLYDSVREWLGTGLLLSYGRKWKHRRSIITPAFHFSILNEFVHIYDKYAKLMVKKLFRLSQGGKVVDVQKVASLALLDVICETSMGVSVNALLSESGSESSYVGAVERIKILIWRRFSMPFLGNRLVYPYTVEGKEYAKCINDIHSFTLDVINKNIAARKSQGMKNEKHSSDIDAPYMQQKKVFIDILLDLYEQGEIDISGIREEVDTFVFEGHDTTSASLSWTLYEIGRHPDIQAKLHAEIDEVSSQNLPLVDGIRSLKYMECVIKESLRLHPPVPTFNRVLEKDLEVEGHVIPAGTIVQIDSINLHLNPAYWPDPEVFNPARFESGECAKRSAFCFVPFSAGSRNCIGQKFALQEEKVFLYTILKSFSIRSVQSPEEMKNAVALINNSLNGILLEFENRMEQDHG